MRQDIKERIEQVRRGEVPEGYTYTRMGIIPDTWAIDKLEKHLEEYDVLSNDHMNIPVATSSRDGLLLQSEYYQQQRFAETRIGYHVVPFGYVTYRHMSDDDIFRFNENNLTENVLVSAEYPVFKTKSSLLQSLLVSYLNSSPYFRNYCRAQKKGSTRTRMYFKNLQQFNMPIPPLAEQDRIVEMLTCCDKTIVLKQQLIDEKRRQKKWLMQNLLDPDSRVRLPGFEGSEWTVSTIGELFKCKSSLSISREQLGDKGVCYLHYGDIHSRESYIVDVNKEFENIPKFAITKVPPGALLENGDLVFVDASEDYDGACKFVVIKNEEKIPFISGLHTIPMKCVDHRLDLGYMRYCFQSGSVRKQIRFYASGMKVLGISKTNILNIGVSYPSITEQTAIANVLSTADREIDLLEQELAKWQSKKKALMQLLLTGIVRV